MWTKIVVLCSAISASAATHFADSASEADVETKLALCSAGDTVMVPAGTASWVAVTIPGGVTLQGAGTNATTGTIITSGTVTITKNATHYSKLLDFRFTGNGPHLSIGGSSANKSVLIGNCFFNVDDASGSIGNCSVNGVIIYECSFVADPPTSADVFTWNTAAAGLWATGPTMGDADTTGESNSYIEDCYFQGILETCIDADNGSRVAFRFNIVQDSGLVCHGGGNPDQDTSEFGVHHLEVYGNQFRRDNTSAESSLNHWVRWRGGGGVVISNAVDSNHTAQYPNKPEFRFTIGCPNPYPMPYQVGQTVNPPDATPNFPFLIFGNTGDGVDDPNFINTGSNPNDACATPSDYFQSGRDYQTSNTWGWAPYEYPHPLRGEEVGGETVGSITATGINVNGIKLQ